MKKIVLGFLIGFIFTYLLLAFTVKITNLENGLITVDLLGLKVNYYYESEV